MLCGATPAAYASQRFAELHKRVQLPAFDAAGASRLRAQVLHAILDPDAALRLRTAADAARQDGQARTQAWFKQLTDRTPTDRSEVIGHDVVVTAVQPKAKSLADAAQRADLQRALAAHPALPDPRAGVPMFGKSQNGSVAARRGCVALVLFYVCGLGLAGATGTQVSGSWLQMLFVTALVGVAIGATWAIVHWTGSRERRRQLEAFHAREAERARIRSSLEASE